MTKQDYSDYSGISIEDIDSNILNINKLFDADKLLYPRGIDLIHNSKNIIYDMFSTEFLYSKAHMVSKYQVFSPQMMQLILNSNYKTMLEYIGGNGVLSELIKDLDPKINVTFNSISKEILEFTIWRFERDSININLSTEISKLYDVVVLDGLIQYMDVEDQEICVKSVVNKISDDGIFCFLVDISVSKEKHPLKKPVDIDKIHSILEYSNMICIYGKNTFSSIWKKMI